MFADSYRCTSGAVFSDIKSNASITDYNLIYITCWLNDTVNAKKLSYFNA